MNNLILGNNAQFAKYPFREFVDSQISNSITSVDLTLMTPHIYVDSYEFIDAMGIRESLEKAEISVNTVTPPPYRYSICADEDTIQNEKTIGYYKQCILFAEAAGAENVIITAAGANYDYDSERLLSNAEKSLKKLTSFAEEHKVTLLLGTVLGEESPFNASTPVLVTLQEVVDMLKRVDSPGLKAYMDVEVISLIGETIPKWFEALGDDIRLVRFTDGNYNGYRIWGKGCFPCEKYLSQLKEAGYEGPLSLQRPGDRYSNQPGEAETEMVEYLRASMEKVK